MWGHVAGERIGVSFKILFILKLHMKSQLYPGFWARHWIWKDECDMVLAFQEIASLVDEIDNILWNTPEGRGNIVNTEMYLASDWGDLRCLKDGPVISKENKQMGGKIQASRTTLEKHKQNNHREHHVELVRLLALSLAGTLSNHVTYKTHCLFPKRRVSRNIWLTYGLCEIMNVQSNTTCP